MADSFESYVLMAYPSRGVAPERADFEDKAKAEKAFADAKTAAILFGVRSVENGVGWVKLNEKSAPSETK